MPSRRQFLAQTAAAGVGGSVLAIAGAPANGATGKDASSCQDRKAPMKDVPGKVAFITGGSSGIGLGMARAFIDAGMKVVITYRTVSHLEEAMEYFKEVKDRVHAIKLDVTDRQGMEAAVKETISRFGKVHVLVNNAGVYAQGMLSGASENDWDWMMNVNVKGVLYGVQAFLPLIRSHGEGGQIMTTSSILGLFVYAASEAGYAASKFAVMGMMESLRMELEGTNIGASVICPGWTEGRAWRSAYRDSISDEEAEKRDRKMIESGMKMDNREIGERILRGMRNNDLYILTHPEWEQMMKYRNDALMAVIPRGSQPAPGLASAAAKMAENSIYVTARNRKRCWPGR